MGRRFAALLAVMGCMGAIGVAGCGTSITSPTTSVATATTQPRLAKVAKTKFALHAALAFGAFHHFIYLPARAGEFSHPLSHKLPVAKAGLAGAFAYHELKLAATDVKSSKVLRTLFAPLMIAAAKVSSLESAIKAGHASSSDVNGINSSLASIKSTAASNGQGFSDRVPSASQLSAGVAR